VAVVVGVEERAIGDSQQTFFSLDLDGGVRVLLPVDNVEKAGLRDLVSATQARKMLSIVAKEPSAADPSSRRQRVAAYKEDLRTGAPDSYTRVLQALLFRSRNKKLAQDERRVLDEARGYFVAELSAVLETPRTDLLSKLRQPIL
jgi:CarD family transcriptional regulator